MTIRARSLYTGLKATMTHQVNGTALLFLYTKDLLRDWDDWDQVGTAVRVDLRGVTSTRQALVRLGYALIELADEDLEL